MDLKQKAAFLQKKLDSETLENNIGEIIAQLTEVLRLINEGEESTEKAAEVSGEDNRLIDVTPANDNDDELVPPPPDPNDDNLYGIPDRSRKTIDTGLSDSVIVNPNVDDNGGEPFINDAVYPVRLNDYVAWEGPLGTNYGQVQEIVTRGNIELPGTGLSLIAEPGDPVCKVLIFRNDKGLGWSPTDTLVGYKMSGLRVIDPLEPFKGPDTTLDFDVERVIDVKGLKVKSIDGVLRGSFEAKFSKIKSLKDYTPDDLRMTKINKGALVDLTPDDVICCSLQAADTKIDRGHERFSDEAIDELAKRYPDKPILMDHDWTVKSIVGKVYDARNDNGDLVLEGYFPKSNKEVVDNILNGTYCKLSVGFAASPDDMLCSLCMKSMFDMGCKHQPGDLLKDGSKVHMLYKSIDDVFEVSLVAVPMQPAAHIRQTAGKSMEEKVVEQAISDEAFKDKDPKKPYGDVEYADPGLQADGKHRYPIDTEEHIRAAWNYINQEKNHAPYTAEQVDRIKARIISAWKKHIDPKGPPSAAEKGFSIESLSYINPISEDLPGATLLEFNNAQEQFKALQKKVKTAMAEYQELCKEVGGVNAPADTIVNGIDTIRNSQTMDEQAKATDNLAGLAPLGTEGAAIQIDSLPKADKKPVGDDYDDETNMEKALHLKLDATHKLIGDVMQACENLNSTMSKMFGTVTHISESMGGGGFNSGPTTGTQILGTPGESEKALAKSLEALHKKLDVAMSASTAGVQKLLLDELHSSEPTTTQKRLWAEDLFPVKDDLGGQQ